jgi:hypothetical protein
MLTKLIFFLHLVSLPGIGDFKTSESSQSGEFPLFSVRLDSTGISAKDFTKKG